MVASLTKGTEPKGKLDSICCNNLHVLIAGISTEMHFVALNLVQLATRDGNKPHNLTILEIGSSTKSLFPKWRTFIYEGIQMMV